MSEHHQPGDPSFEPRRSDFAPGPMPVRTVMVGPRPEDDPFGASLSASITEDAPVTAVSIASLLRRKWTIALVALAVVSVALPAIWTQVKPEFKSTATVHVAPVRPRILYHTDENGMPPIYQNFLNTQVALILSPEALTRVLDREDVKATKWYQERPKPLLGSRPSQMERLAKDLLVMPRNGTELIDVSMSTIQSGDAATIVNAVVRVYEVLSHENSKVMETERLATLQKTMADANKEISRLADEKFKLADQVGSNTPDEIRRERSLRLDSAKRELAEMDLNHRVEAISTAGGVTVGRQVEKDPIWQRDHAALTSARNRLELAQQQYGPSHPKMKNLKTEVTQAENALRETESRLMGMAVPPRGINSPGAPGNKVAPNPVEINKELFALRRRELDREIKKLTSEVQRASQISRQIAKIDENIAESTRVRDDARKALQDRAVETQAPARISISSLGIATALPTRDRRPLFSVLAVFFAIGAGLGTAYLRSSIDTNIYEVKDLTQAVVAPFLGRIPRVRNPLAGSDDPSSELPLREAVRMVRTAVLKRLGGVRHPALVVTSPGANSGKTTMTILLGRSLARLGKKVLVVDADLRSPALSWTFDAGGQPGLRDVLSGEFKEDDVIKRASGNGFSVLPAGTFHGDGDAELLANGVLSAAIQRWRDNFDVVLIDSPPVLPVADARILAGHADGTLMVLRSSHCKRSDAVEAYAELSAAGARLVGSVLVGATDSLGRYSYHYGQSANYKKLEMLS